MVSYPETKDSGVEWIGKIPKHWNVKQIKHTSSINDETLPDDTNDNYQLRYIDKLGYIINVVTRFPNEAIFLKTSGNVGQISFVKGSFSNLSKLTCLLSSSEIVINCVYVAVLPAGSVAVHSLEIRVSEVVS